MATAHVALAELRAVKIKVSRHLEHTAIWE